MHKVNGSREEGVSNQQIEFAVTIEVRDLKRTILGHRPGQDGKSAVAISQRRLYPKQVGLAVVVEVPGYIGHELGQVCW